MTSSKIIHEAPVDYGDTPERMHSDIEKKLRTRQHTLGNLPSYPASVSKQHFEELLATKRFKDIVERLRRYANITKPVITMMDVVQLLDQVYSTALQVEAAHKPELEQLAVKLIEVEFDIKPGEIKFEASLKQHGEIDMSDIPKTPSEEQQAEVIEDLEELNLEVAKRRLINSLIQGAAVKTTYAYHLIADQLNKIDPSLITVYSILATLSEYGYWLVPDEVATASGESASVGKARVDVSTDPPTIIAEGTTLPFLIQELAKGVMELLSLHGLPSHPEIRKHVLSKTDFLDFEHWDLRLGPNMWERFVDAIGEDEVDIRSHLYATVSAMPAKEFNNFMKSVLEGGDAGKKAMASLAKEIRSEIKAENQKEL